MNPIFSSRNPRESARSHFVIDQFAVEPLAAGRRLENAANHVEQRALARSARAS
jgi:hypothetical protein